MTIRRPKDVAEAVVEPVVVALRQLGCSPPLGGGADETFDEAARMLDDPAIGLTVAQRIPIGALGEVDYMLCSSATLRLGLARLTRFYPALSSRVLPELVEERPAASLVFRRHPGPYSRHWAEFPLAMIAQRIRQVLGVTVVFEGSGFAHPRPPAAERYDHFFGAPVRFGLPHDRLRFPAQLLDTRLRTASVAVAEMLERHLTEAVASTAGDLFLLRLTAKVRELLDVGATGVGVVARALSMSSRTLQRELHRRGRTLQQVLDDVRRHRAEELLERGDSIAEVAAQLGFSETSAFFRAFRRWTGTSPRASRGGAVPRRSGRRAG